MSALPAISVAEQLAERILSLDVPPAVREKCIDLGVDVIGLIVTARNEDYLRATLAGCDDDGPCTAIGHARALSAAGAALVNGTAAHGEDFDDTFEGGPVHAGAVVVPAARPGWAAGHPGWGAPAAPHPGRVAAPGPP